MSLMLLLVENDAEILRSLKGWIQALSVEVLALSDSREAARRIPKSRFDGFLLEAKMPSPDGFELTTAIRALPGSTAPIVLLTDLNDVETMRKAFKAGITIFLTKPVTQERLTGLIRILRGPMLAEKRHRVRIPCRIPVECPFGGERFKGSSINVGEGGMLLESCGGAQVGQRITVSFNIPNSPRRMSGSCQVVRREGPDRMGVQFEDFSPGDLALIRQFIRGEVKE
jgi:CheY-like chemotaxis protein